jgi:DNA-binding transcriptional LysR family regulator
MEGGVVELRQLRHFVALAEEGSVTQAAVREQIVQSGLSNSIHALERSVGSLLYVRGTRPVRLTDAGTALLGPARQVLNAADDARARVRDTSAALTGSLRVGVMQSAEYLVPLAASLAGFARDHPGVDLHVTQSAAATMLAQVEDGRLNCAVVPAIPDRRSTLRLIDLAGEPLTLVCRRDHPLSSRPAIALRDLAEQWFVEVQEGWSARGLNDAALTAQGLRRRIRCEVNEWLLLVELIAAGLGVGFVPAGLSYPALTGPDSVLVRREVTDHKPRRDLQLALPRGEDLSAAARAFAEHLQRATARPG